MSALDDVIYYHADNCQSGTECDLSALSRAELAQLRADLQAARDERDEAKAWHISLNAMIDRKNATIAEQARRLDEVRKALHGMVDGWRYYANGHYCRTYNPGMTQGLNCAADALGAFVSGLDAWLAANPAPEAEPQP